VLDRWASHSQHFAIFLFDASSCFLPRLLAIPLVLGIFHPQRLRQRVCEPRVAASDSLEHDPMTEEAPVKLLLTPRQAAAALQLSERTLWELTRRGEIKRIKINSCVRYDVKDLEAFIEGKKREGVV